MMTTYSAAADMLLGTVARPVDAILLPYVQDGADRIDAILGERYVTPIVIDGTVAANRSGVLLLKQINNYLATGMFIIAAATDSENNQLNAYGAKLINDANGLLFELAQGSRTLTGAVYLDVADVGQTGPLINNLDATSLVENFYGLVTTPFSPFGYTTPIFPNGNGDGQPYYGNGFGGF